MTTIEAELAKAALSLEVATVTLAWGGWLVSDLLSSGI